jgi:hypothetical protein
MRLNEVALYENKSHRILQEGWHQLTEAQQKYQLRWERELFPLLEEYCRLAEADLTADQIQAIFQGAEETAMASGDNKNLAGKVGAGVAAAAKLPVDIAKKVDAKINELGAMAQKAGPVQNADAQFEKLKADIKAKNGDSKIVQGIEKVSAWAKENPGKASLAVGILTAIAAFAGGPAGGAAAGLILRASKDLLQGEKLSSAVGKSIKTGVYGALAGMAFRELTDNVLDNIASAQGAELDAMEKAMNQTNFADAKAGAMADLGLEPDALNGLSRIEMTGNINAFNYSYDTVIPSDQMGTFEQLASAMDSAESFSPEHYQAAAKFHDFMATLQNDANAKTLTAAWDAVNQIPEDMLTGQNLADLVAKADSGDAILDAINGAGDAGRSIVQGALATVDDKAKNAISAQPVDPEIKQQLELDLQGGKNPEQQNASVDMAARLDQYLAEADPAQGELPLDNPNTLGAKMKRGLGKAASAVGGAAKGAAGKAAGAVKQAGKDLGNKVTANKLNKAWKAAGEPTDAASIANILSGAGMSGDQIKAIGQAQSVDLPQPAGTGTAANADAGQPTGTAGAQDPETGGNTGGAAGGNEPAATGGEEPAATTGTAANADAGQPQGVKGSVIKVGDTQELNGKTYKWEGAVWTDTATNKSIGVQASIDMGLPHPKIDPIRDAIKAAGADVAKLVIDQINSKGVEAGTKDAQVAKQAGAKGTEELPAAQNKPKAGIAKPGTVAAKPKPTPTAARMAPAPTTIQ